MMPNLTKGRGLTGAIGYCLSEGGRFDKYENAKARAAAGASRVEIVGGQNFGFAIDSAESVELARKVMEWAALPQNQAGKTYKVQNDCLHLSLSWDKAQAPERAEMERAAKEALAALGMAGARAVFIAHHDTEHKHLHIIASRIDPETGKAFSDTRDMTKAHAWALQWEKENGQITEARKELHKAVDAVQAGEIEPVLDYLTARKSTFTPRELSTLIGYAGLDDAQREAFRLDVLSHAQVIGLKETAEAATTHYTTRDILAAERTMLRAADRMSQRTDYGLSSAGIAAVSAAATLNTEQDAALRHAARDDGIAIIAGEAGTGKSRTLGAIREGYEAAGYRVVGMSWTNAVVQDMRADGFANATTIAAELIRQNRGFDAWDNRTVLIVDEAAMLSTKHLAEVVTKAEAAGAKLILAGDDKQLASIERGGMFKVLADVHGAATLKVVQRTKDADQQQAFNLMHRGEFGPALDILDQKGAVQWKGTQREALRAVAETYAADHAADPGKARFIFAYTNADVAALNGFARELAREAGRLDGIDTLLPTTDGPARFAKGDRIQFTGSAADRAAKAAGLVNGNVGTVAAIEAEGSKVFVTVALDAKKGAEPRMVRFAAGADKEAGEFQSFRHGYAGTIYKGQGRTLDQSYVYHSQHWKAASSYVALTRHRESVTVFAGTETAKGLPELAQQMARNDQKRAASAFMVDPAQAARVDQAMAAERQDGRTAPAMAGNRVRVPPQAAEVKSAPWGQAKTATASQRPEIAARGASVAAPLAKTARMASRASSALMKFLNLIGSSKIDEPEQERQRQPEAAHDPVAEATAVNAAEMERRRRALLDKFERDLEPGSEEIAATDEVRRNRDRGRTR